MRLAERDDETMSETFAIIQDLCLLKKEFDFLFIESHAKKKRRVTSTYLYKMTKWRFAIGKNIILS